MIPAAPSREAVEAACIAYFGKDCWLGMGLSSRDFESRHFGDALTAALPHLAPVPSQSDDLAITSAINEALDKDGLFSDLSADRANAALKLLNGVLSHVAAVRVEERERAVKIWKDTEPSCQYLIPDTIRARTP